MIEISDKTRLLNAEKDFYVKHFEGVQNLKIAKIVPNAKDRLNKDGLQNLSKLRKMLKEDGYNDLVAHLKQEFESNIATSKGGKIINADILRDYLAEIEIEWSNKSAIDGFDADRAQWVAGKIMAETEVIVECTPRSILGRTESPTEDIRFVEDNLAVSACTDPDNGFPVALDTLIAMAGGHRCVNEVKLLLRAQAPRVSSEYSGWRTRIPMANGIYDIPSGTLHPYPGKDAPLVERLAPYRLELNYTPNCKPTGRIAELLDKVFLRRQPIIDVFCCFLGIGMSTWLGAQVCLVLKGERARNGKSTVTGLANQLVGEKHTVKEALKDIFAKEHGKINLAYKLINIGDDLNEETIKNQGDFNALITNDHLRIAPKNVDQYYVYNWLTCFYNGNVMPKIGTGSGANGVLRRLVILPMDAVFSIDCKKDNFEAGIFACDHTTIDCKYTREELEELASYCLALLKREYNARGSVININIPEIHAEHQAYYGDLDSVYYYLDGKELLDKPSSLNKMLVADVYEDYVAFLGKNTRPLSVINFGKRLRTLMPNLEVKSVKGNKVYIYKGEAKNDTDK